MIHKLTKEDEAIFLTLLDEFYHSSAVLHPIPEANYQRTFDEVLSGSPYLDAFLFEKDGKIAGYGQISLSWSTEAGGIVVWLEEIYIRPEFQGQGLGQEYFAFIMALYEGKAARFRLEVEHDNAGAIRLYKRLGYQELPYLQMLKEFSL